MIAADHARRGGIATDDLRVVAARAGGELEFYFGRRLLLVDVRHHLSPKVTILPTAVPLLLLLMFACKPAQTLRMELWR